MKFPLVRRKNYEELKKDLLDIICDLRIKNSNLKMENSDLEYKLKTSRERIKKEKQHEINQVCQQIDQVIGKLVNVVEIQNIHSNQPSIHIKVDLLELLSNLHSNNKEELENFLYKRIAYVSKQKINEYIYSDEFLNRENNQKNN